MKFIGCSCNGHSPSATQHSPTRMKARKSLILLTAKRKKMREFAVKSKIYLLSFLIVFNSLVFTNFLNASEIPVIVIAPSKKAQSISTVGSSVIVLDEEFI